MIVDININRYNCILNNDLTILTETTRTRAVRGAAGFSFALMLQVCTKLYWAVQANIFVLALSLDIGMFCFCLFFSTQLYFAQNLLLSA